ncbi:MAG: chorismate mutase [Alphaproteobacteria bacterium]|nr:chorismate mutase [Alphaproteobacteria bacterium]
MSKTLSEIREKIDEIDNHVHDLLMERAALVSSVAEAKRKEGLQVVQPAREAMMIRRLLARHGGPLPQAAVVRIWRELVGSVALLQTGLSVVVAPGAQQGACPFWDMAKNYFGTVVPMRVAKSLSGALVAVREDEDSFAIMPWPELDDAMPWWVHLFGQAADGERLSVICALPYGQDSWQGTNGTPRALVVAKIAFLPSDDDFSFIGIELDSSVSRARVTEVCGRAGLVPLNIYSAPSPYHDGAVLYFVEVGGFVEDSDPAMEALRTGLGEQALYCGVMGGYPAVPEFISA